MSCGPSVQMFRLLDAYVGWDVGDDQKNWKNLSGLKEPDGVRLSAEVPGAIAAGMLDAYILPPRLARGCGTCEWYLITPAPPESRLLRRAGCNGEWLQVWPSRTCSPGTLIDAVAIATHRHLVAIADRGYGGVNIWSNGGNRLTASIPVRHVGPIAFTNSRELLVTRRGSSAIRRYGPAGDYRG